MFLGVGVLVATATAAATPVPVVAVTTAGAGPSAERMASVVASVGPDALAGSDLARALGPRLGEPEVAGDPLGATRREADAAAQSYLTAGGTREVRRRLASAVETLGAGTSALEAREDNRAVYLRALVTLARIALDARQPSPSDADEALRRAAVFDPGWAPDPREFPPAVVQRHAAAVAAVARTPQGTLAVQVARPGCAVRVDGRAVGADGVASLAPGAHRVRVLCPGAAVRVHPAEVVPGARVTVAVDPALDAAVDTAAGTVGDLGLRYGSVNTTVLRDAAALGRLAGARRVVAVTADGARVVDVESGREGAGLSDARVSPGAVQPASGETPARPWMPSEDIAGDHGHGASAGPWVLMGVGAAGLVASGVLYLLRIQALGSASAACPAMDGHLVCPVGTDLNANPGPSDDRARAVAFTTASGVALGVGAASLAAGALWQVISGGHGRVTPGVTPGVMPGVTASGAGVAVGVSGRF